MALQSLADSKTQRASHDEDREGIQERALPAATGLSEFGARRRLYRYREGKLSWEQLTRPAETRGARVAKQNKMEAR